MKDHSLKTAMAVLTAAQTQLLDSGELGLMAAATSEMFQTADRQAKR